MANRYPLTVNVSNQRLEELPLGENIDLSNSGIYDGSGIGTFDQILTSTGNGISWKNLNQLNTNFITTETDPVFTASPVGNVTTTQVSNWDSAYGWGNHANAGYLTSYTETDPVFSASVASGITATNISNWDSAYSWGDHGQAGYLTNIASSTIGQLSDVDLTTPPTSGQVLTWNSTSSKWIASNVGSVNLTDFSVTTRPVGTAALTYNNTTGVFTYTPPDLSGYSLTTSLNISNWDTAYGWGNHAAAGYLTSLGTINGHTDVDTTTNAPTAGQALVWDAATNVWKPGTVNTTASLSVTTNPAGAAALSYNSGTGVLTYTPPDLSGYLTSFSETDTLDTVASRGASTSVTLTLQDLLVTGNLTVQGTTTQNNVTSLNVVNNEIVINDGQASPSLNGLIRVDRGSGTDTLIRWNEVTDKWQFTNDGTAYYDFAIDTGDLTNNAGFITGIGSLSVDALSDVDTTTAAPTNGQALIWDNSNSQWKPGTVASALTVKQVQGNGGTVDLSVSNVNSILFDNLTGFNLTDNGNGEVYLEFASTFKTWYVAGQTTLVASGEDSIELIAGSGISLSTTTSGTGSATKAITITSTVTGGSGSYAVPTQDAAPTNPSDGDLWWKSNEGNLKIYYDDGNSSQWVDATSTSGGGGATVTTSDAAPSNPTDGDLWWKSNEGRLKIYYQDTDSSQWVDASPPLATPNYPVAVGCINMNANSPTWTGTTGYTVAKSGGDGSALGGDVFYTLTFPTAYSARTDYIVQASYDGTDWVSANGAQIAIERNTGNVVFCVRRWNEDPLNLGDIMITITNL